MKKSTITPQIPMAFMQNEALAKLISADSNPYHALHVAKAFQLAKPKTGFKSPPMTPPVGNPWMMLGMKK